YIPFGLFVIGFTVLSTLIRILPYKLAKQRFQKRIRDRRQQDPSIIGVYRAQYGNKNMRGELYLSKSRVWMERYANEEFSIELKDLSRVTGSYTGFELATYSGTIHNVYSLLSPDLGAWTYSNFSRNIPGSAESKKDFVDKLTALGVNAHTEETSVHQVKKPWSWYFALTMLTIGSIFIAITVIVNL
ncbi:MAG: hypothetical protein JWL89_130, partial [Candidatus Saccharibacteria bacterium]|nr:hypothetical protein [Candidatus Saccharibacteria bacterium]